MHFIIVRWRCAFDFYVARGFAMLGLQNRLASGMVPMSPIRTGAERHRRA